MFLKEASTNKNDGDLYPAYGSLLDMPFTLSGESIHVLLARTAAYSCTGYALHNFRHCYLFRLEYDGAVPSAESILAVPRTYHMQSTWKASFREPGNCPLT